MTKHVGVVLVNWNSGDFTLACLRSVCDGGIVPRAVVVVDNGSRDGSPDQIAREFPTVEIVRNASNEGFARANNIGVARLLARKVDFIWVLNNDTTVSADSLAELLRVAEAHPDAACITGKIFRAPPSRGIWYGGGARDRLTRAPRHILDDRLEEEGKGEAVPVEFVSGCNMLVPSRVLEAVGGFRSAYVAYSEDSEWCWRVRQLGYLMYYAPSSVIWHHVSGSVRKNTGRPGDSEISARAWYLMVRNHFWTLRLHVTRPVECLVRLAIYSAVSVRIMVYCLTAGQPTKIGAVVRGAFAGLFRAIPDECSVTA